MENELIGKRRLIIILVVATVVVFVALVWVAEKFLPRGRPSSQSPTQTIGLLASSDCTHTIAYWKAHPELYPAQVIIGGVVYQERELEALLSDDSQELPQQLRVQMAVAFMNNQAGADQGPIETALFEAYGWLVAHPSGSQVTADDLKAGQQLFYQLEAYNQGLGGVEACESVLSVTKTGAPAGMATTGLAQPGASITPSATSTPPVTDTGTLMPTTPSLIYSSPTPSDTPQPPTNTPAKTKAPTPTKTPKPPTPTNTPKPPTPTDTPKPATPTFTLPPLPSPTFTLPPT